MVQVKELSGNVKRKAEDERKIGRYLDEEARTEPTKTSQDGTGTTGTTPL